MKEIIVLSGKEGTGKTVITAFLAALAGSKVLTDCDVEAAALSSLLKPVAEERYETWDKRSAFIDEEKCNQCGLCEDVCRSGAISDIINNCRVDSIACEGCRLCYRVCPEKAISIRKNLTGNWFVSGTGYGPLVHAELGITQDNSGKLVTLVREKARQIAEESSLDWIISDGPAGIGGPVISSLFGSSLALLVTEPTPPALHGLERIVSLCRHFNVPAMVCINKHDINTDNARDIELYCAHQGLDIVSRIPFDNVCVQATTRGLPALERNSDALEQIKALWKIISGEEC